MLQASGERRRRKRRAGRGDRDRDEAFSIKGAEVGPRPVALPPAVMGASQLSASRSYFILS